MLDQVHIILNIYTNCYARSGTYNIEYIHATVNNISAISWRPVLVVEEAGVPGENH
jgi:hypothetical protein